MVQIDPVPVPHFSTYVCKLEAALRDAGIPFQIRKVVRKTLPRGKMPALHWNGRVLTDSQAILDVLAKERVINRHPDSWLNAESRAAANFFRNTIEHLAYHLFTHERWIDQWSLTKETYWPATSTPWFFRFVIADMFVQPDVVSNLSKITGCYSNLEREALVEGVWEDAAALLGNKKYFLSETELSSADYSAFGLLFNILAYKKLNPKSYKAVARHANLVKFVERVKERLYPDVFAK
ncbi:hypothetical protein BC830DRAFT_1065935 [Chytriomyces sp. MP71]|nr:hypothetical protein BC830DRAFT_1065935 [Chytriomyces sp. MP71]